MSINYIFAAVTLPIWTMFICRLWLEKTERINSLVENYLENASSYGYIDLGCIYKYRIPSLKEEKIQLIRDIKISNSEKNKIKIYLNYGFPILSLISLAVYDYFVRSYCFPQNILLLLIFGFLIKAMLEFKFDCLTFQLFFMWLFGLLIGLLTGYELFS